VKKRILIVTQYFWPEDFRVNELAKELSKRGHIVDVLTGLPNYPSGNIFQEFKKEPKNFYRYKNINIYRAKHWLRGKSKLSLFINYISFSISSSIYALILSRRLKYDFVLGIQLSPIFSVLPGTILKRVFRTPFLIWILDIWPDSIDSTKISINKFLYKFIENISRKIYSSADILFLTSQGFEERLHEMKVRCQNYVYLPQWVEQNYIQTGSFNKKLEDDVKKIISRWPEKKVFLFAGNIGEAQDFSSLLSGFKETDSLDKWVFLILGDGRYKEDVLKQISANNLGDNVFCLGRYPSEYMPIFYKYADFLIFSLMDLPIFSLTLPGKVQSYMSSGTPILGMVNGEAARVIEEANCGYTVPSGDINAFSEMINNCFQISRQEVQQLGLNGRNFSKKEYDARNIIDKLENSII
tara:strand:- start:3041 stop:4273 length:1233 start_codon:yes stop_codon:yes gene_type:complete